MDMITAIATELKRIFPDVVIYREQKKQGFKEPSFYVHSINSTVKDELGTYQFRRFNFALMYFPDSTKENVREQCEIIQQQLMDNFLHLSNPHLRLKEKEMKIIDNVLQMTFTIDGRFALHQEFEPVKELDIKLGGKKHGQKD